MCWRHQSLHQIEKRSKIARTYSKHVIMWKLYACNHQDEAGFNPREPFRAMIRVWAPQPTRSTFPHSREKEKDAFYYKSRDARLTYMCAIPTMARLIRNDCCFNFCKFNKRSGLIVDGLKKILIFLRVLLFFIIPEDFKKLQVLLKKFINEYACVRFFNAARLFIAQDEKL